MILNMRIELGFVGVFLQEEYDGAGMGILENCLIQEEFSAVDLGINVAITSSAFGAEVIQAFGTEEQKQKYLPPLVKGEAVMGSALTEPNAGSDLAAAITTAVREGEEYVINGSKMFITTINRTKEYLEAIKLR